MCITAPAPRREHRLWWALVGYFRAYPPLVQGQGLGLRRPKAQRPAEAEAPKAERPRIRVYW